jgi:hypothetical protein
MQLQVLSTNTAVSCYLGGDRLINNIYTYMYICLRFFRTVTEVFHKLTEVFLTLTEVFPCFFLSCKANAKVKLANTGHGPHYTTLVCICVVRMLLFVLFGCFFLYCSMYCLCVNVYCHRVTTQLQLMNNYKYNVIKIYKYNE